MERFLFLMIPPIWGGLVLGMGYLALWSRKRSLCQGHKTLATAINRESAENTEEAFYWDLRRE